MRNGHVGLPARINHWSIDLPKPPLTTPAGTDPPSPSLIEKDRNIAVINSGMDLWPQTRGERGSRFKKKEKKKKMKSK